MSPADVCSWESGTVESVWGRQEKAITADCVAVRRFGASVVFGPAGIPAPRCCHAPACLGVGGGCH